MRSVLGKRGLSPPLVTNSNILPAARPNKVDIRLPIAIEVFDSSIPNRLDLSNLEIVCDILEDFVIQRIYTHGL